VVFEDGLAKNDYYAASRSNRLKGADDYGMMYEVLFRRYTRALEEKDLPDLVLVDGGKGQLHVAQEVFKELKIREVDLVGLAKERKGEGARSRKLSTSGEKVFHPHFKEPLVFGRHSPLIHFLDRVRDEAHRFAITYHKKVRGRGTIRSALGSIPGVGPAREKALLRCFGSVEKLRDATLAELAAAPKMNAKLARTVYDFFHSKG
jgi:excinuclease ABC subunit C